MQLKNDNLLFFFLYGVGDTITTYIGIQLGAVESNTIPLAIISMEYGYCLFFIFKIIIISILWIIGIQLIKYKQTLWIWTSIKYGMLFTGVYLIINNFMIISRL